MRPLPGMMACFLLFGLLGLGGCGKKTPPVPPESVMPAQIADLRADLDPHGVTLRWSWPRKTEKGANLRRVDEFVVERAVDRVGDFCADCPLRYQAIANLPGGAVGDQPELSYRDESLQPGYHYAYRVLSSLGWRIVSAPSLPVALSWQVPLTAPTELAAEIGEREVTLRWQSPFQGVDGKLIAGPIRFQVYRSEAGQPFRLVSAELTSPSFVDQEVKSSVTYQYRVRAGRVSGGTGEFSAPLTVTLRDLTPPPSPFGLAAVVTGESVRLFWELPSSEDLAGTQIYRRRQLPVGIGDFEMIGQVEGRTENFVDPLPLRDADEVRHYALKSYDRATPPNLSEFSREAQTTKTSRP